MLDVDVACLYNIGTYDMYLHFFITSVQVATFLSISHKKMQMVVGLSLP